MPQIVWPWGVGIQQDPNPPIQKTTTDGPFSLPNLDDGEFGPFQFIQTAVSKVAANADRVFSANKGEVTNVSADSPAWYNIYGRVAAAAGSFNEGLQSTLIKVIIIIALVAVIGLFGMSYIQTKGQNFAK